jgi:Two component regulator propeller.
MTLTDKNSLVYNEVRSLLEDEYGEIWVGTYYWN